MTRWALALFSALLGGCVTLQSPVEPVTWALEGRLAVRTPSGGQAVSIRWEQNGAAFKIWLTGPLGQGATVLSGDSDKIDIQRPGEPPAQGEDPVQVMRRYLGWSIPIESVRHWVRGEPSPRAPVGGLQRDSSGRLEAFTQSGFTVTIERPGTGSLPRRIVAERGAFRMVLKVRRWWPDSQATGLTARESLTVLEFDTLRARPENTRPFVGPIRAFAKRPALAHWGVAKR